MPVARRDRKKALPDAWWRTRVRRTQGAGNGNYRHGRAKKIRRPVTYVTRAIGSPELTTVNAARG